MPGIRLWPREEQFIVFSAGRARVNRPEGRVVFPGTAFGGIHEARAFVW
jgi:hypothetical protein